MPLGNLCHLQAKQGKSCRHKLIQLTLFNDQDFLSVSIIPIMDDRYLSFSAINAM